MTQLTSLGYKIPRTPENEKLYCNDLTITPEIISSVSYGPPEPPVICYRKSKNFLYLPRYYGYLKLGIPDKIEKYEITSINLEFKGTIRDYQKEIIDKTMINFNDPKLGGGIWHLSTGTGKTIIFLYLVSILKVKTLVVVHKQFLVDQWIERIKQFLPEARIGIIKQNVVDTEDKDIVIGMIQSISKREYDPEIFKDFGCLAVDESHCINSRHFSKTLFKVQTKYKLGLSATPNRKDGLDKVITYHMGPVIAEMNNTILDPIIHIISSPKIDVELKNTYTGNANMPKLITDISNDETRNEFLINILLRYIKDGRKILVFSDRVKQCKTLCNTFNSIENNKIGDIFVGGMTEKAREQSKEADIMFGTYSMCREAFDVPKLDTVLFATPRSDIIQAVGRILRQHNKNTPIVVDVVDHLYGPFKGQHYKRKKYYKEKLFKIFNVHKNGEIVEEKSKSKEITVEDTTQKLSNFGFCGIRDED
jgi:superfamily II DNA or RNA helicase